MGFACVLSSDEHPPMLEIITELGVCCLYLLRLQQTGLQDAGVTGCWGRSSSGHCERRNRPPHVRPQRGEARGPYNLLTEASALLLQQEGLCGLPGTPCDGREMPTTMHSGSVPAPPPPWLCVTCNFVCKVVSPHPPKKHLGSDALLSCRPKWGT